MSKSKMSADKIVEIMKWRDKGLNATDVSRVLGISDSCTQKYVSIINSIRKKETVANTAKKIKAIILRELGRKK